MISNKEWEILLAKSIPNEGKQNIPNKLLFFKTENISTLKSLMNSSLNLSEDSSLKDLRSKASQVMNELQKKNPQYFMNGSKNIWILKPTSKKPNFF